MGRLEQAGIEAAAARLRGQVVATPLLGVGWLPGVEIASPVRVKAEIGSSPA